MRYGLKPLKRDLERDIKRFIVGDIESRAGWIHFILGGAYHRMYDDNNQVVSEHYVTFRTCDEMLEYYFSDENPRDDVFLHFGGGYDMHFFLKSAFENPEKYYMGTLIPRGSRLLCFEVATFTVEDVIPQWANPDKDVFGKREDGRFLIRDRTITFRDSSALLPFSLASLTKNFKVEHLKGEIDYDSIQEVTPELEKYLESDVKGLYEVLHKFYTWDLIRAAGPAYTMASQAVKVLRTYISREVPSLSPHQDIFVRQSYFGGRTEIFKPFFEQSKDNEMLNSYDVNSLYPAVMHKEDMPGGFAFETKFYLENKMGFYDVEVEVPDSYIPVLATKYKGMENKLIFPTGIFRGVWSTVELNYAMTLGTKIRQVYNGMIFHNIGPIFRDYVAHLYEIRKNSPKVSVDNVLCKLLMNSTYGRCGLNIHREQLIIDRGQVGLTPHMVIPVNDGKIRLAKQDVVLESSFTNVAIAAWVTSQSRIWMHRLIMESPHDMYYMDTDGLKTTFKYPRNDDDLGKLKLEYKSKRACFVLPKTYMEDTTSPSFNQYDRKSGKVLDAKTSKKIAMKGFDKREIQGFVIDDFYSSIEGEMGLLRATNPAKFAPLRTAISKGKFLMMMEEAPRQIRSRYTKRRIFKRAYSQIYDSEPLHIKDGEIVNLDAKLLKKWQPVTEAELSEITNTVIDKLVAKANEQRNPKRVSNKTNANKPSKAPHPKPPKSAVSVQRGQRGKGI